MLLPRIERLEIAAVQSIESVVLDDVGALNLLVGRNGSGKSSVLRALSMTLGGNVNDRPNWVRDGQSEAQVNVTVGVSREDVAPHWQTITAQVPGRNPPQSVRVGLPPWNEVVSALGTVTALLYEWRVPRSNNNSANTLVGVKVGQFPWPEWTFNNAWDLPGTNVNLPAGQYQPLFLSMWNTFFPANRWTYIPPFREVQRIEPADLGNASTARGERLANTLVRLRESRNADERALFEQIRSTFRDVVGMDIYATTVGSNLQLVVSDGDSGHRLPLVDSGSGLENFAGYVIHILDNRSTIIGLEEPESHLHPKAQRDMWRWILKWAKSGHQLFVATHSALPDEVLADEDVRLYVVDRSNPSRTTTIVRKSTEGVAHWPELGYSAAEWIGTDGLVIVEGESDVAIIARWLRKLRPERWYRVLRASGKGPAVAAGQAGAFGQLWIPFVAVVDRDGRPHIRKGSNHVHVLERYEIENFLLDAQELAKATGNNVERARDGLESECRRLGPEAWARGFWDSVTLGITNEERKAWTEALAGEVELSSFPLSSGQLKKFAEHATDLFLNGRETLFRRTGVQDVLAVTLQTSTDEFWRAWQADPTAVIPGKEVLASLRTRLHPTMSHSQLVDGLIEQLSPPQALVAAAEDLEDQIHAWTTGA